LAAVLGAAGALGLTMLLAGHPFDHHPGWHLAAFAALWAALLFVSLSLVLLRVRTPTLRIGSAAALGIVGLGLAGLCSPLCPDPHFLRWWGKTALGGWLSGAFGLPASALCFGLMTTVAVAAASAWLVLPGSARSWRDVGLPAAMLFILLEPGVALQSVDTSLGVFGAWTLGTALACPLGVRAGAALHRAQPPLAQS
jgi:hypothetical protein